MEVKFEEEVGLREVRCNFMLFTQAPTVMENADDAVSRVQSDIL